MTNEEMRPGGPDPFISEEWSQIERSLVALLREVSAELPRDRAGEPSWLQTRTQLVIYPGGSHGEDVPYIPVRDHTDELVEIAQETSAYEVLASHLPRLSNHLAGQWRSDLDGLVQAALERESPHFDRDFLEPLLILGIEANLAGLEIGNWASQTVQKMMALVEPNEPEWLIWWLVSNTNAPSASQGERHTVELSNHARLVSIPHRKRGRFHSEMSEDGFGPTLGELRRCAWRLEVAVHQGADPSLPDVPSESQFATAHEIRDQVLTSLGLSTQGNPITCWWDWEPLFWAPRCVGDSASPPVQPARPKQHYFPGRVADVDDATIEGLSGLWSRVARAWEDGDLRIAMRRFHRATRQPNEVDCMRDLFSTLDHLLLQYKEQGKGDKIARRSSHVLAEMNAPNEGTYDFLKEVYLYRNEDIHDATPPTELNISRLRQVTRRVVTYALHRIPWSEARDEIAETVGDEDS